MADPVTVNPNEGQVAIPWARAEKGYVVGRLGARAMRWAEESLGVTIDELYTGFGARAQKGRSHFPVRHAAVVVWAGIEHERRLQRQPGPEYTIDDVDEMIDEVGIDDLYSYALALIQFSAPFKKRTEALATYLDSEKDDSLGKLRAAATAAANGTGTPTSPPPSEPASPSETSGT